MSQNDRLKSHPCYSKEAHLKVGRIHLPVAPSCNIQCRYCVRGTDCVNESPPGVSSGVINVDEAVDRVNYGIHREERIRVVGIVGPGDPLNNRATFDVLRTLHREHPELILCLSTNGLLLPDRLKDLLDAGVSSLTVTINAATPETAARIYNWITYRGRLLRGDEAARTLLNAQWSGLAAAVETGFMVKLNFVYLPGVNGHEAEDVARVAGRMGVDLMNIIPLLPQGELSHLEKPGVYELTKLRDACDKYIPQMRHCRQCRADAFGLLGSSQDAETEILLAAIGDEYAECLN